MPKNGAEPEKSILKDQHDFLQKFFTSSKKGEFSEQLPKVEQIDSTKLVILIAEDDPTNYMYLEIILKKIVKRIDHAMNGQEAVDLASKKPYDLVLMDLDMPIMNGIIATQKIKQQFPDLPIIAQTAYTTQNDQDKAFEAGCDDFIKKPFKKGDLIEIINRTLKKKTS